MSEQGRAIFRQVVEDQLGSEQATVVDKIYAWVDAHGLRDSIPKGGGVHGGQYFPFFRSEQWEVTPFGVTTDKGHVFVNREGLSRMPPFRIKKNADELLTRLYEIDQVVRTPKDVYPHLTLADLQDEDVWHAFFAVLEDAIEKLRRASEKGIR